ncbi:MAG: wax ester/triacylglycerol synthase family O-acyltransferase [Polyangiaceae bacterium]|nr:wax ester/triacylglycerol synthase family O-acyltransferase [Polyangiaceae bacterium]
MSRFERLSALDCAFLYAESPTAHMHVGSLLFFEDNGIGEADIFDHIQSRLHYVPRFRKKVRFVPGGLHRPVWVDDPHFDLRFHVRWTGLPKPRGEREALALMGRVMSQPLDRQKPLWEMWVFDLEDGRRGLIQKTHHCLIDGVSGVDLGTVLLDFAPDAPRTAPEPWSAEPEPSDAELTRDALLELRERPRQLRDAALRVWGDPEARDHLADKAREVLDGIKSFGRAAAEVMPRTSLNAQLGAHRRYQVVRLSLSDVKRVRKRHDCTVNDVVLSLVTSALRKLLLARGERVEGLVMKAMVPVSVRDASQARTWGNKVSMIAAELPVGEADPVARLARLRDRMTDLKRSRQAVGAEFWVQLGEYAPPTLLSLVGRAVALQRMVNLVVTNVPGPQFPLYLRGARMLEAFPYVPVFAQNPLGVAVLSYDGALGFGLTGDWDAVPDLDLFAAAIRDALAELDEPAAEPPARGRKRIGKKKARPDSRA